MAPWLAHLDDRLNVFLASGPDDPMLTALTGPGGFASSEYAVCLTALPALDYTPPR